VSLSITPASISPRRAAASLTTTVVVAMTTDRHRPVDVGSGRDQEPGLVGGQVHTQSEQLSR
jgi:hypothetical protein